MKFVINVLWNLLGTIVPVITATVLTPIIIDRLGANGYGIWTLSFTLIESLLLFDFGLRSAAVKFVAHHYALKDEPKLTEVLHTSFLWAAAMGAAIFAGILATAPFASTYYKISPEYKEQFPVLLILVGFSFCLGLVFNLIRNALDAVQRFDLTNRTAILGTFIRTGGSIALLQAGFGLIAIGVLTIGSQLFTYAVNYFHFRRVFPGQRLAFTNATKAMFRELWAYGIHMFFSTLANLGLVLGPPFVLAKVRSDTEVGYFNLPARLLQFTSEVVGRMAVVTGSKAAELAATNQMDALRKLSVYSSRYALAMFFPVSIWFLSHGERFLGVLAKPPIVEQAMLVLPAVTLGSLFGFLGQSCSFYVLMAMARHAAAARMQSAEAVILVITLFAVVPTYGISGAAWAVGLLMILNRGLGVAWFVCRELRMGYFGYLLSVYGPPVLTGIPAMALAYGLAVLFPGQAGAAKFARIAELLLAAAAIGFTYWGLAYFLVLLPEHRGAARELAITQLRRFKLVS